MTIYSSPEEKFTCKEWLQGLMQAIEDIVEAEVEVKGS
jgi:hypothetical protein